MKLIQRIGYYLGGFSFGLIILAFFLNGKKVSCSYGPDARVLKNIRQKQIVYPSNNQDTLAINYILKKGDVNFSESDTRKEPCGLYVVDGEYQEKEIKLTIENCDSIATITSIKYNN
ncbi:hypothetical protein [Aestuariibaculum suncheonense]|uniref:DUF4258 domain-containing protein n=1 Tax=Aestuariibaculum suncheonense TaxID=1028745 RepID=A0A8J6Q947_9FLAO|nr:hypothetical protein [Aestuariibaculum suncheonense]MBD0835510.1 hypothetical protein [Aestuariibaculum suncheonense]